MKKQRKLFWFLLLTTVVFFALFLFSLFSEGFGLVRRIDEERTYNILSEEQCPRYDVTDFVVTEDKLMVHYSHVGLTNVYTKAGDFQYGIQVGNLQNGRGGLAYENGVLYILAKGNVMFLFRDKQLESCFSYSDDPERFNRIEKKIDLEYTLQYEYEAVSYSFDKEQNKIIEHAQNGQDMTLLDLPDKRKATTAWLAAFALSLVAALYCPGLKRKGDQVKQAGTD